MVKAFSVFKGCKQGERKALCKEGENGGMGSVLVSERNLVCIFQSGGTKLG